MTYNFIAESFYMGKLKQNFFEKSELFMENVHFAFQAPSAGLGATHVVHIRLIVKPIVDFLLVITKFFLL